MMMKKSLFIVLSLFVLSVIIRLPNLNRPLSKHHEFNAAFILIPMDIWYASSGSNYNFSPILNYQNLNDKGINNFLGEDSEKNGSYYYMSFGAGAYIIPYFFLSFFGPPSVLGLQIFGLLIHLLTAVCIYKISSFLFEKKNLKRDYSFLSVLFFLFLPSNLWFFANGYTHHSLVVFFFLATIYYYLKISEINYTKIDLAFYTFFLFLAIYTEWIGCFLAFAILILQLIKRNRSNFSILFVTVSVVFLTLFLIGWQYASLIGWDKYLNYLKSRFLIRSDLKSHSISLVGLIIKIGYWYIVSFGAILIFLCYNLVIFFKKNKIQLFNKISILFILPIALHHIVFSDFTFEHDYSVVIDSSFIVLASVYLFANNLKSIPFKKPILYVLISINLFSIIQYYVINKPGKISQNGEHYDSFKNIGELIKSKVEKDEVVMIKNLPDIPNPQVVYYSKRNFLSVVDFQDAIKKMKFKKITKGFYVEIDRYKVSKFQHINLQKEN